MSSAAVLVTDEVPPAISPVDASPLDIESHPKLDRRAAFRAAMNAGIVASVLTFIPVAMSFVFAMPFAGFLCVLLYRRHGSREDPSPGVGFRLGVWAGLAGFAILVVLTAVSTLGFHAENELRDGLIHAVHQAQSRYSDPEKRQAFDQFLTPGGLAMLMALGLSFMGILFAVLSGIGGAVSAVLLRRKPPQ